MNTKSRRLAFIAGVVALSLTAAACGSDEEEAAETTAAAAAETTAAAEVETTMAAETTAAETETTAAAEGGEITAEGEVIVSGSSTVEPISIKIGELLGELSGGKATAVVDGPGTGDGFKLFCAGETDISDASRKIKDEEAALCADAGIEYTELAVAIDGLTVATSPNNSAIECLDNAALYALMGPESEGFGSWADAKELATTVGSKYADIFPDADLVITAPGEESGTYDTFVEFAIAKIAEAQGVEDAALRADYSASGNDNLIVEGIEGSDSSLGFVGYAFYASQGEKMKAISIENKEGTCVAPTDETIADGSYPYSRTLYIYVNNAKAAENPAVQAYVDLYVSEDGFAQATEAGYVALPADAAKASADAWSAVG